MASIYRRRNQYWIKFRLPGYAKSFHSNLGTGDIARARLICRKVEFLAELSRPEFVGLELPATIRSLLAPDGALVPTTAVEITAEPASTVCETKGILIETVLAEYLVHIREENAPAHVANKLTHLRRFFGARLLGLGSGEKGVFTGNYDEEKGNLCYGASGFTARVPLLVSRSVGDVSRSVPDAGKRGPWPSPR